MAQIKYIKDLFENEEASLREISRITGHSFGTVRKYAYQENWSEDNLPDIEPQSYPVLRDYIPIIDKWLEEDRKAPRKQRHTVIRIYHRLRDEQGFTGCYSTVKKYVRKKKFVMKTLSAGYLPLDHPKGWGQVDFGLAEAEWAATGERFPFYALTISFPGSNHGVTQAFPSQNQECLLEGMKRIFERIGGVPPRLRFDNMTTAVAQVLKDGERVLTDGFTRFMLHYRFQAIPIRLNRCKSGFAHGKRRVDSLRQCYYMTAKKAHRPAPLKLSSGPLLNYNPNLSAYDGLIGGEAHG